jgi:hypothetical protein
MVVSLDRRRFLGVGAAAGALAEFGDLGFLAGLPPVAAGEVEQARRPLRVQGDVEPVVRMLMETPRERLLEEAASRIKAGLSYRELLAGLLLAGVTNIEPRPEVGFKFHGVLVVNSAHLASLSSPPEHRWLPIFWAIDYYKDCEARDVRERGDWRMLEVDERAAPPPWKAREALVQSLDRWDESAADAAAASLARSAGAQEITEVYFRYGCRDFRSIGHKAIFAANCARTLHCVGWEYSEPVLRSLTYALLNHEGGNPADRDADADRPYRANLERLRDIRENWADGRSSDEAASELIQTMRAGSHDDASAHVVALLNAGVAPQSVWDALHVAAAELLMRQPAIVALHAVTTTNALHYAYRASGVDETRRLLMLQNAAFLPMFREAMARRGALESRTVDDLAGAGEDSGRAPDAAEIFSGLRASPLAAARKAMAYLRAGGAAEELIHAARLLVFLKGDDAHDYKFSSAVLEDYRCISPQWRATHLAANVMKLRSSEDPDNALVARTRAALA